MPRPPAFPSFEVPGVIVRLPPGASNPVSERIGGATWSGVVRAYRLYPMAAGRFRIPPRSMTVTFADPETRDPVTVDLRTDEIAFEGTVPAAAEGLDPFIAAAALTLEQTVEGTPDDLAPGGAVTRTVTARVVGTAPLFLPPLIPPLAADGLAAYPSEPVVVESEADGVLSGERMESVTYVAEAGGRHATPPIRVRWFNLAEGRIETAEVAGFEIAIRGPTAPQPAADGRPSVLWIVVGALCAALAGTAGFRLRPRVAAWRRRRREAYRASEAFAFDRAVAALRSRDTGEALRAVALWSSRALPAAGPVEDRLADALSQLGATRYGRGRRPSTDAPWTDALAALRAARRGRRAAAADIAAGQALPPLNPRQVS